MKRDVFGAVMTRPGAYDRLFKRLCTAVRRCLKWYKQTLHWNLKAGNNLLLCRVLKRLARSSSFDDLRSHIPHSLTFHYGCSNGSSGDPVDLRIEQCLQ